MTQPKDLTPYASPQHFYGSELRRVREAAGYSQDRLGDCVFCSGAYIGQIEAASRRPQLDLSQRMDVVLETGGYLERLCEMVLRSTKHAEYFAEVAGLLAMAKTICEFSAHLIPGLLQTEAYARALIRSTDPLRPEEKTTEMVRARLERAILLDDPTKPQYWAILHESALRLPVCDRVGMNVQLMHLAGLMRSRRVAIQVIPNSAGAHPLAGGMVTVMTFEDAPPAVYVEGPLSGHLLDSPSLVGEYQRAYDYGRAVALSPEASLDFIESVAKEYSAP